MTSMPAKKVIFSRYARESIITEAAIADLVEDKNASAKAG
jgi:hypothetical protein